MNLFRKQFIERNDKKLAAEELDAFAHAAKAFVDEHPNALVIIGDPRTDVIFMAHQGVIAPARIINRDGSRNFIVANALKHERGQGDIDRFLLAIDGGLYAIAKTLHRIRKTSLKGRFLGWVGGDAPPAESKVALADGAILSPIQPVEG